MADPDPTGWRDRARDPAIRTDEAALVEVIKTAPVADQSVPLFLALDRQLNPDSKERLPFLKRIQQAHPGDFWVNLTLGDVLPASRTSRRRRSATIRRRCRSARGRPSATTSSAMALLTTGRMRGGRSASRAWPWTSSRPTSSAINSSPSSCRDSAATTKPSIGCRWPSASTPTRPTSTPTSAAAWRSRAGTPRLSPSTDRPIALDPENADQAAGITKPPGAAGSGGRGEGRLADGSRRQAGPARRLVRVRRVLPLPRPGRGVPPRPAGLARNVSARVTDPSSRRGPPGRACSCRRRRTSCARSAALAERAVAVEPSKYEGEFPFKPLRQS